MVRDLVGRATFSSTVIKLHFEALWQFMNKRERYMKEARHYGLIYDRRACTSTGIYYAVVTALALEVEGRDGGLVSAPR